jgi:hypothetical protein
MASEILCATASLEIGEPLAGTAAAGTSHWLVLEHAQAWGPKGVDDSGLPTELTSYLGRLGKRYPFLRVQLVRRAEARAASREQAGESLEPQGATKLYLARSDEGLGQLAELPGVALASLPELGLEAWLERGELPARASVREQPLYLVCVHGKRDRCCALRGLPLYNALRAVAGDQVWQTTHLGGHRFAATMLVLPHGICYGRLGESEASGLAAAHGRAEFYALDKVRGRTCHAPGVQAAEVVLRQRLGELRLDALRHVEAGSHQADDESGTAGERVSFVDSEGSEHDVLLQRIALAPAPASCGATPKPGEGLLELRARS